MQKTGSHPTSSPSPLLSPPPNRQHSKGIKLGRKMRKLTHFTSSNAYTVHANTYTHMRTFSHSVVLDVLVELKALLIMHEINRKDAEWREKKRQQTNEWTTRKMYLSFFVCMCVDKTWNKSKSTALGRIFHLTVTKSTKHLYSFKPNKFFVSSHIHVACIVRCWYFFCCFCHC